MGDSDNNNIIPQVSGDIDQGDILAWTSHPLKRKPLTAVLVTIFILAVGFLVLVSTESKAFGTLALVVLFASLAKFYFPTKFQLSESHIKIKTTTQTITKKWSQFRSYYPDKNGVLLSPFVQPSRLENFRGLYLMFENNRNDVIGFVQSHIGRGSDEASEGKESS